MSSISLIGCNKARPSSSSRRVGVHGWGPSQVAPADQGSLYNSKIASSANCGSRWVSPGFHQKVGWSVSGRRGALHYFRDLIFWGLSKAHPGATAVLVDELDAGGLERAPD